MEALGVLVAWIAAFGLLTYQEWEAINIESEHQEKQREYELCLQQQRFAATIGGLNVNLGTTRTTLSEVKDAVNGINTDVGQTKEALNLFTGDDSFPYFDFDRPDFESGHAKKIGRYPISDVTVNFGAVDGCGNQLGLGACRFGWQLGTKYFPEIHDAMPTPTPAANFSYSAGIPFTLEKNKDYSPQNMLVADITARNGIWREYFTWAQFKDPVLSFVGNERDIRIYETLRDEKGRPNGENLIWECRTKHMPRVNWDLANSVHYPTHIHGKLAHLNDPDHGLQIDAGIVISLQ